MKRICFGITKLGIGGAERVLVDLANELQKDYDITIFTIYGGGDLEKEVNRNIKIINMYKCELKNNFISLYILIYGKHIYNKFIKERFDIDIAFLEGPITRIFSYKGNNKKVAWVHNDISKVFGTNIKAKIKRLIDKKIYKKYDKIIFVSEQNKRSFEQIYGDIADRQVIYNYINKNRIIKMSKKGPSLKGQKFITVARLVKQKRIDRFIRIHRRLLNEGLFHKVYVIGDGKEKEKLLKLVDKMKVKDTFIFLGNKENPYPFIKAAEYFTLLSDYEGYGMVIEEAKILNKPIIITNTAAVEAVRDYEKKLIVENDEESIYNGLKNILLCKYKYNYNYIYLNAKNNKYTYDNKYLLEDVKKILK